MTASQIRDLYDQDQRKNIVFDDSHRETADADEAHGFTVRLIGKNNHYASVVYCELNTENADATIQRELDTLKKRVKLLEWKYFTHDQPDDLLQRLKIHGFSVEDEEAIMVLDTTKLPDILQQPVTHDIRRITSVAGIREIIKVQHSVELVDMSWLGDELVAMMTETPDSISIYGAYVDGKVVSSAWVRLPQNTDFASLWGGSTLPEYRKRGFFTALVATRVQEAKAKGYRYVTVDASPMSRPILEKHGFEVISTSFPCVYTFD